MITRRTVLAGLTGGLLVGISGIVLTRGASSVRFIGQRDTIIALLDTETTRILVVLGEPNDWLMSNIPGLSTAGKSRIDLVVGSHRMLASLAAREYLRIDSTPTIVLQGASDLPPIRGDVSTVINPTTLELSESWSMSVNLVSFEHDHPDFAIEFQHSKLNIALTNSTSALKLIQHGKPSLLAVPGDVVLPEGSGISTDLLVTTQENQSVMLPQLVVFPTDPEIVRIQNGGLELTENQLSS